MKIKLFLLALSTFSILWVSAQPVGRLGFAFYDSIPVIENGNPLTNAWMGGLNNPQFSKIDLDYDGDEDLFIFDRSTHQVYTFIYDPSFGGSNYHYTPEYEEFFPNLKFWALLRDYNCDGLKDIFTYTVGGFMVYINKGSAVNDTLYFEPYANGDPITTDLNGSTINVQLMANDIPGITDVDGDGDIDLLHFPGTSNAVQYNKNLSMETYGHCDSLIFEVKNECWGRFTEGTSSSTINLYDTLAFPCDGSTITNPESSVSNEVRGAGLRHVGSTLTAFDEDGSGVLDLLIGDVDGTYLTLLNNGGTQVNSNSSMVSVDTDFPSYDQSLDLFMFPAAYYEDVNNDDIRDLLIAPNMVPNFSVTEDAYDKNCIWYYENTNTDADPTFNFQSTDFLQNEMIDVGRGAFPIVHDIDEDGLKDLLISRHMTSYPDIANKTTALTYYKNTGTANDPVFTFVTPNFASIQNYNLGLELVPAFGDIDGDGDEDLILGNFDGDIHWLEKTAPASYNPPQLLNDANGNPISVFQSAYPSVVDLNRDGALDLVIGKSDGNLTYYSNSATDGSMELNFETSLLGGVDVTAPFFAIGHATPFFLDLDGAYYLFVGSRMGQIFFYTDIDNNLSGNFTLQDSSFNNIREGFRTSLWMEDVEDNGTLEMFIGSFRGGVMLYQESDSIFLSADHKIKNYSSPISVFPNPTDNLLHIEFPKSGNYNASSFEMYTIDGQMVKNGNLNLKTNVIFTEELENGIYILLIRNENGILDQRKVIIDD